MPRGKKNIRVDIRREYQPFEVDWERLKSTIVDILRERNIVDADICIAIAGDADIARINKEYLDHEGPTDVISFDLSADDVGGPRTFDIVVNADMAVREAAERRHSPEAELALYVVHGLLHGLGYDDAGEKEAAEMHLTEDDILRRAGYGTIYTCD